MVSIHDFRCYTIRQLARIFTVEFCLFLLAFLLAYITNSDWWYLNFGYDWYFIGIAIFYSIAMCLCMALFGLYMKYMNLYLQEQFLRAIGAIFTQFLIISNISYWLPDLDIGKQTWLASLTMSYTFILISRTIFYVVTKKNSLKTKTIVLGASNRALQLKNSIEDVAETQTDIIGFVHKPGERERLPRERILDISLTNNKGKNELLKYCLENNIATIVVAVDDRRTNFPLSYLLECKQNGINVIELMEFYEHEFGREQLSLLDPSWVIYSNKIHLSRQQELNKVAFDTIFATLLLLLFLPVMFVLTLLLKINYGFRHKAILTTLKIGRFNKPFRYYEFNCYNKLDALSVTGRLIKYLNIVGLPSLFNIVKGEVSFIGPQVISYNTDKVLSKHFWYYKQRYSIKPGLYSWGYDSVVYDLLENEADKIEIAEYQLQYDLFYSKKRTLLLDILVLISKAFKFRLHDSLVKQDKQNILTDKINEKRVII